MIFDIGPVSILLLCLFVLILLLVCSRLTLKLGLLVGFILGILNIAILTVFFSYQLFSLSHLAVLLCLVLTGLLCSRSATKSREQQQLVSDLQEQLDQSIRDTYVSNEKYQGLTINYANLNEKYHRYMDSFSKEKVYKRTWDSLTANDPDVEKLIGLFITQLDELGDISAYFSKLLLSHNPNIFAVTNLDGSIIAYNDVLLSLYGYTQKKKIIGSHILDFIQPSDVEKASLGLKNAVISELRKDESYIVKTRDGFHTEYITLPAISFRCTGNPLVMVAYTESSKNGDHSILADKPSTMLLNDNSRASKAVSARQLIDKCLWHIDDQDITTYVSEMAAALVGYTASEIIGRKITDFLDAKNYEIFHDLCVICKSGERSIQNIDLKHKYGKNIAAQLELIPVSNSTGSSLGMILTLTDISERRKIEKALHHRIAMEEMITSVSTRFIGIASDKLDDEIIHVLDMISEFTGVKDSYIKLSANDKIGEEKHYKTNRMPGSSDALNTSSGHHLELVHGKDTIMIPLSSRGQSLGFFRCTKKGLAEEWLSEDIKLIRLAGEIFVNALARRNYELNLSLSEERLRVTLSSIGDAVIAVDNNKRIIMLNETAASLIGLEMNDALGNYLDHVFMIEHIVEDAGSVSEVNHIILTCINGQSRYISLNRNSIRDGENRIYGEVIIFRDITEEKVKDQKIRYFSFHDKLTGLYNRAFFEEEIRRLDTKRQYPITIIIGDCNGLKLVNDVFGHQEGDELLKKTADILKLSARKEDIIARWGGDEFVMILPKTDEKIAAEVRERIITACVEADNIPIQPSIALGSATKTEDSLSMNELLKEAEERMYRHKLLESRSTRNGIIASFEKMLFERNYETEEHAKRLQEISQRFGRSIGLSDDELDDLSLLATLHDIGKIGIPDNILLKPASLTKEEWEQMERHSEKGYNIAKATNELKDIANFILYHHEKWDGSGYPEGLTGTEIPKLSRMLSIIDAYDVITHARPYKQPLSHREALDEISRCAGIQFDPELAETFMQIMEETLLEDSII